MIPVATGRLLLELAVVWHRRPWLTGGWWRFLAMEGLNWCEGLFRAYWGWNTSQLCGDYAINHDEIRIPLLNTPYNGKYIIVSFFFVAHVWNYGNKCQLWWWVLCTSHSILDLLRSVIFQIFVLAAINSSAIVGKIFFSTCFPPYDLRPPRKFDE